MQKKLLFFSVLLWFGIGFSQTKISYVQDLNASFTIKTIENANFKKFKNPLNNGLKNGIYWFKIDNITQKSVIQFSNNHLSEGIAFVNSKEIYPENNERFLTFVFKKSPTFIKLNITKEAYIPIITQEYSTYKFLEKKENLYTGFYYGFAFVVVLINLFYFINFKDNTFLYYALFLFGVSTSLFFSDGILNLLNFSDQFLEVTFLVIHICTSIFGALFAKYYLQTNDYYPKLFFVNIVFLVLQVLLFVMYLVTNNFIYFVFIEILAFSLLGIYWIASIILFHKNIFIKVFAVAYVFIFILGVDYYVLKLFGLQVLQINRDYIKIAGFFEMILLSFAVIYRMKILQEENTKMRSEITQYATQISSLSEELKKNKLGKINYFTEFDLSEREQEIFTFLTKGKSNKEIADALFISVNTVKYHIKKVYSKLNIKNRKEVKQIAIH